MIYNTQQKDLRLPDYGRTIHKMIDYCKTLSTKEERNRASLSIIGLMGNIFPHLRDVNEFKHILWDHLFIMADFDLDIDTPYEIIKKEELYSRPKTMKIPMRNFEFMHYGNTIERIIEKIPNIENEKKRDNLSLLVALHMKRSYLQWNKEVDDHKIFADIFHMSRGAVDLRNSGLKLNVVNPTNNKQQNNQTKTGNKRKRK